MRRHVHNPCLQNDQYLWYTWDATWADKLSCVHGHGTWLILLLLTSCCSWESSRRCTLYHKHSQLYCQGHQLTNWQLLVDIWLLALFSAAIRSMYSSPLFIMLQASRTNQWRHEVIKIPDSSKRANIFSALLDLHFSIAQYTLDIIR